MLLHLYIWITGHLANGASDLRRLEHKTIGTAMLRIEQLAWKLFYKASDIIGDPEIQPTRLQKIAKWNPWNLGYRKK